LDQAFRRAVVLIASPLRVARDLSCRRQFSARAVNQKAALLGIRTAYLE
jgi:hypothetical protein